MSNTPFDIERAAQRLGRAAGDAIDPDRIAGRVVTRLRRRVPWWQSVALLRAAAVVVLIGGGAVLVRLPWRSHSSQEAPVRVSAGVLDGLSTAQLSDVLDSMALDAPPSTLTPRSLHDLSEAELRELLSMES